MKKILALALYVAILSTMYIPMSACTNFLVTKGASTDGSTIISYAADSHVLYGELYHTPAAHYEEGAKLRIHEWDTGKYLGEIDQVAHTYNVVGNVNENQVAIGETTYTGMKELQDTTGIMDYGSLIYITLQRAKNARDAIRIMDGLVTKNGYYSTGESFSISDPNEVWILEMIGKGTGNTGAVWVARQIPDGYVSGHANQARITTFPYSKKNDWFNTKQVNFNSKDVISFARERELFSGKDKDFSFSDTYAAVDFGGARFCEIRVWGFFDDVAKGMNKYWDYVKGDIKHGKNGYAINRMPLWIKPDAKISAQDIMFNMRNHLEGTELDMRTDIGAGPFGCPYRWRPLTWKVGEGDNEAKYVNERATATQQTGFSFVAQLRSWLPNHIGGINWFSVDDAASSVYMPMYSSITEVPKSLAVGNGSMMEFSYNSAFWIFNLVSNFAYTRYDLIHPDIEKKQKELEESYIIKVKDMDAAALANYKKYNDKKETVNMLTNFSVQTGDETFEVWKNLWTGLFVKYMDGNVKEKAPLKPKYKYVTPKLTQPGYGEEWEKRIIKDTGNKLENHSKGGH